LSSGAVLPSSDARADQAEGYRQTLSRQRSAWDTRPYLRALYGEWFEAISARLALIAGPTVEIGCGIGAFKEFAPQIVATDVLPSAWTEQVVDATQLPYDDGAVANLVMIDVLHHLPQPSAFLGEAERVLPPGGRLVCLEPYCSPVSTAVYKAFHHETTDLSVDPFSPARHSTPDPFDSNQALPTLIFWRHSNRLAELHPRLRVVERRRLAMVAYPLSGGFTKPPLVPGPLRRPLLRLDEALAPLAPLLAFRCMVTVERR
jgi:SAM-dependent methyltransferase